MTRYFAGNTLAAFSRIATTIAEVTTAGLFDSAYVDRAIQFTGSDSTRYIKTPTFSASPPSLWVRFDSYMELATNYVLLLLLNGLTNVFRIRAVNGTTVQAEYWNGSAWTSTGATFPLPDAINQKYVCRVDLGSGFEMFNEGASVASGSGWTGTLQTTVTEARMNQGSGGCVSQVMIADYDLRDSHFAVPALNGNSAVNTGGTGSYTDVVPPLNDATAVKVTTAGNKQGQTKAAITVPGGYIIGAMVISGRGRASGTITDGKLGVRTAALTNSSGSGLGYNSGYEPRQRIVETDPDTATEFTQAGFNSAEIYEEAV